MNHLVFPKPQAECHSFWSLTILTFHVAATFLTAWTQLVSTACCEGEDGNATRFCSGYTILSLVNYLHKHQNFAGNSRGRRDLQKCPLVCRSGAQVPCARLSVVSAGHLESTAEQTMHFWDWESVPIWQNYLLTGRKRSSRNRATPPGVGVAGATGTHLNCSRGCKLEQVFSEHSGNIVSVWLCIIILIGCLGSHCMAML